MPAETPEDSVLLIHSLSTPFARSFFISLRFPNASLLPALVDRDVSYMSSLWCSCFSPSCLRSCVSADCRFPRVLASRLFSTGCFGSGCFSSNSCMTDWACCCWAASGSTSFIIMSWSELPVSHSPHTRQQRCILQSNSLLISFSIRIEHEPYSPFFPSFSCFLPYARRAWTWCSRTRRTRFHPTIHSIRAWYYTIRSFQSIIDRLCRQLRNIDMFGMPW